MTTKHAILIVCPIGLGNFLMAEPTIRQLSQHFGKENCHLLALRKGVAELAMGTGLLNSIHSWDPDTQGLSQGLKIVQQLRKFKFAWVISLFPTGHWKYTVFLSLLRYQRRVGFNYGNKLISSWFQRPCLPINLERHDVEQNLRLACAITGRSCPIDTSINPPLRPIALAPLPCEAYFICHPGSSAERLMEHKRLPPKLFGQLIDWIFDQYQIRCVLIGGPEEKDLCDQVSQNCQSQALIARPTKSLADLGAVMASSVFFLGNDSGLMHLASALQRPVAAFFGPTDERRTGPWSAPGVPTLVLRRHELACGPCWTLRNLGQNSECPLGNYPCLQEFPLELAIEQLKQFIALIRPRT